MATPDVTIMGAGIFGLSCAWAMARRGARIRVIDPAGIGAGASGGIVGALAPHVPERWNAKKQFQFESLMMADGFWAGVEAVSGLSCGYARTGRLQPVADADALATARQRGDQARTLWHGRATWSVIRATGSIWEPPSLTGWLIHDTMTARIAPRRALAALAAAIRTTGGEIAADAETAGPVLWATGVQGLADLTQAFARPMGGGVKGQAALIAHDAGTLPQIFMDGTHAVPHADGTVAIGSTSDRVCSGPASTDDALERLLETVRAALPALARAPVIERWAGARPRAATRAPMLGQWPDRPGHFVANGGFKIGFGMAPKAAEVMADLILGGHDAIPDEFRVEAGF